MNIFMIVLSAVGIGLVLYAVLGNRIDNLDPMQARIRNILPDSTEQTETTYEDLRRARSQRDSTRRSRIQTLIDQAGLNWTIWQYERLRFIAALASGSLTYLFTRDFRAAGGVAAVSLALMPYLYVNHKRNKRIAQFLKNFPIAVDIMVRAVLAGLPITSALRTIVDELKDPIQTEFRRVTHRLQMGDPVAISVEVLFDRVPVPEVMFFISTIGIQQRTGGSLAGTLQNLSVVLRERAQMYEKIKALSAEARTTAYILGALPFFVISAFSFLNPEYLKPLISTRTGWMALGVAAIMMILGGLIMKKMINFKV